MPTISFEINRKCFGVIRAPGVQITTISNRINNNDISFNTYSYNELQMRRKAEVLQYKNGNTIVVSNKKILYSDISNTKGGLKYSQATINQIISQRATNEDQCSTVIKSLSTNSGIRGDFKTLLYYNPSIPLIDLKRHL
jgi:hypothetical protein